MRRRGHPPPSTSARSRAGGFVLVTSLILLVVLIGLAIMAMRGSLFGERMSRNEADLAMAREAAELALRDAERDILGVGFDGRYCSEAGAAACGGNLRPPGSRPVHATDARNFWVTANAAAYGGVQDTVASGARPGSISNTPIGIYSSDAVLDCGKPLWEAADWDSDTPRTERRCADGARIVRTVEYGSFTGAPHLPGDLVRRPRYLIEVFDAQELIRGATSNRLVMRITATGFGRTPKNDGQPTSVTLQAVFSP